MRIYITSVKEERCPPVRRLRLNPMQMRIRDLLAAAQKPLSAYDVIDALREDGRLAPPTVYRALQKLIDKGLAHRLETQNAYVACRRCDLPQAMTTTAAIALAS